MTPVGTYTAANRPSTCRESVRRETEERHVGIEPTLTAWRATVLSHHTHGAERASFLALLITVTIIIVSYIIMISNHTLTIII